MKLEKTVSVLTTLVVMGAAAVGLSACDDPGQLTGGGTDNPNGDPGSTGTTSAALECTASPQGRSYVGFDGAKLELGRVNENLGVNRARVKPFNIMASEYQRVLGMVPADLSTSASSFDVPPERWFAEAQHSGMSLNAIFSLSFQGCLAYATGNPSFAAAPTADSAPETCATLMRKAWSHTASPDEIAACTSLATSKLSSEPDARRRWAYVCASVLSSSQFLTF